MSPDVTASPLSWPMGRPRTPARDRKRAPFGKVRNGQFGQRKDFLTIADARERLEAEVSLANGESLVISSNLILNRDGTPRSSQRAPDDPGVAVYFILDGRPVALACDRWDRAADNIAAVAKHIESLRGQDRWGVGSLEQAFAGYVALPAPASPSRSWRKVMNFGEAELVCLSSLSMRYRELAMSRRSDEDALRELNVARDEAKADLSS